MIRSNVRPAMSNFIVGISNLGAGDDKPKTSIQFEENYDIMWSENIKDESKKLISTGGYALLKFKETLQAINFEFRANDEDGTRLFLGLQCHEGKLYFKIF